MILRTIRGSRGRLPGAEILQESGRAMQVAQELILAYNVHRYECKERNRKYMLNQATIECRVFHPTRQAPDAPSNIELEGFVREVISQTALDDLQMRFFGRPLIEAIPGRITGRIPDRYEQPRDCVIVAFEKQRPVGYADAIRFAEQQDTAEFSLLVRTDKQRRGIGKVMLRESIQDLRQAKIKHLEAYVHPENIKMNRAFQKWSRPGEMQDTAIRKAIQEGEVVYLIDI
jgi:RimJ/RimL family protein N-acetyltransferase